MTDPHHAADTMPSLPLLSVNGEALALQYTETELKTRAQYALVPTEQAVPEVSATTLPQHLSNATVTVVDSVFSGTGRDSRDIYAAALEPIFSKLNVAHTYIKTTHEHHVAEIANGLDLTKNNTIIMISGDTSVYELFNALNTRQYSSSGVRSINLLTVPFGSGNALALSSGVNDEVSAIQSLFDPSSTLTRLPLYQAQFPEGSHYLDNTPVPPKELLFSVVLTFAMHAKLVWIAEQPDLRSLGIDRFKVAAGKVAQTPLDFHISLSTRSSSSSPLIPLSRSSEHAYLNIFAVPCIEKNYYISPQSHIDQTKLHMLHIDMIPPEELMQIMVAPYAGPSTQHTLIPSVEYKEVDPSDEIVIQFDNDDEDHSIACIDGIIIYVKSPKGKQITVRPATDEELGFKLNVIGMKAL